MKNIERGSIKHLILLIAAIAICSMILYPLFDFIFYTVITKSEFKYSFEHHLFQPIVGSFTAGIVIWLLEKRRI